MRRLRPVVALLLLAPVCAEYLSAYLPQTGDLVVLLAGLLVLGPLYGGAAVLIHEVAARTGRGWRGMLLLGGAYGVLQAGVIDLSLVTRERTDVAEWSTIVDPTAVPALGMSAYPVVAWVVGHAVLSTGAPIALVEGWSDGGRGRRPWLGVPGTAVVAVLFGAAAALIHLDQPPGVRLGVGQLAGLVAVAAVLVVAALSPAGAPVQPGVTVDRGGVLLAAGVLGQVLFDVVPPFWPGVVVAVLLLVGAWQWVSRRARRRWISPSGVACLAAGAVLGRVLIGTLAPPAPGVSEAARLGQAAVFVVLAVVLALVVVRRHRLRVRTTAAGAAPGAA